MEVDAHYEYICKKKNSKIQNQSDATDNKNSYFYNALIYTGEDYDGIGLTQGNTILKAKSSSLKILEVHLWIEPKYEYNG